MIRSSTHNNPPSEKVNTRRPTQVSTFDFILTASAEEISIPPGTASFLRGPRGQEESCPDGPKSTDLNLPHLYQISYLRVKENHRMAEMPEYRGFILQAPHSPQFCPSSENLLRLPMEPVMRETSGQRARSSSANTEIVN